MYYVYAHLRKTDNSVFYIGKGSGDRAFVKRGRNKMWQSVFAKHGCLVVILKRFKNEEDAFEEEKRLIAEIGLNKLTNMASGGVGAPSVEFTADRKEAVRVHLRIVGKPYRDMIHIMQGKSKKRIFTDCGRSFLGSKAAEIWLKSLGHDKARYTSICSAARRGGTHKGVGFRYKEVKFMKKNSAVARPVGNSKGEIYPSIRAAAESMRSKGIRTTSASIHGAINGKCVRAGGLRWGYVTNGEICIKDFERPTKTKRIIRSDGLEFPSLKAAAEYMGDGRKCVKNISLAATGKIKTAYGYGWKYQ